MNRYSFCGNGLLDKVVSPIKVDVTDYETKADCKDIYSNAKALWDTGSTVTVISSIMVEDLGLIPTDITTVHTTYSSLNGFE